MRNFGIALLVVITSSISHAKILERPKGKGKCPAFSLETPEDWKFVSARPKGDRWNLEDKSGKTIARFDYKLPNTDQRQLPEVEDTKLKLGGFEVQKYTVAQGPFNDPEEALEATTGLVTGYTYSGGALDGLVVMTPDYDRASKLDEKIETALKTLKLTKK